LYNQTGKLFREIGVPTKAGKQGSMLFIIPGIGALATFSPILNYQKLSIKGI
jgi:glutaminase